MTMILSPQQKLLDHPTFSTNNTMLTEVLLVCGIFMIFKIVRRNYDLRQTDRKPPPEPPAIPLLGHFNVFTSDRPLYKIFAEYSQTYGPVVQFRLAASKILILNDAESVSEAFLQRSEDFAGRPKILSVSLLSRNDSGIVFSDFSPSWKLHKKLTGVALQRYVKPVIEVAELDGEKIKKISVCEKAVWEEIDHLLEIWKHEGSKEVDVTRDLQISLMNTVCNLTFSRRYQPDHPELNAFFMANQNLKKIFRPGHPLDVFPILKMDRLFKLSLEGSPRDPHNVPVDKDVQRKLIEATVALFCIGRVHAGHLMIFPWERLRTIEELTSTRDAILQREYEYHLGTYEPNRIRNITDALLAISKDVNQNDCAITDENANYQGDLTEDHVIMSMWEVFAGGFESTLQILRWAIAFLVNNPRVQHRIRKEIRTNIRTSRRITWDDRSRLPYLMATILETLRKASFSSLNAPHRTTCDTRVSGYDIDMDTTVFTNLWWIHNNPEKWQKPDSFYPEHFLDDGGNVFTPKSFFPFSAGARICLGEKMAKMQLFLFLGRILRCFRLEPALDGTLPHVEPESNEPVRIVGPYQITLTRDELTTSED